MLLYSPCAALCISYRALFRVDRDGNVYPHCLPERTGEGMQPPVVFTRWRVSAQLKGMLGCLDLGLQRGQQDGGAGLGGTVVLLQRPSGLGL